MVYFVVSVFLFAQGGGMGNIFIAKTYHLLGLVNPVSLSKFSLEFSFGGQCLPYLVCLSPFIWPKKHFLYGG